MSKGKIHTFDLHIYPRKVFFGDRVTLRQIKEQFLFTDNTEIDIKDDVFNSSGAFTLNVMERESGDFGILVVANEKIKTPTVAHEAVHVAANVFNDTGMTMGFTEGRDEHFAYLVGYIVKYIMSVIR